MKQLRQYIRHVLIEKSLTGNRLERVASLIAKEVTEYLLDDGVRTAFANKGKLQFQIDVELPKEVIWLRDIFVTINPSNGFNSDAKYEFDLDASDEQRKTSDLMINLYMPQDYSDDEVDALEEEYESDIRHELEHSGQSTNVLMDVQKTIKSAADIWSSLKNAETYYVNQAETPAHTSGWVQKAKRKGIPASDMIDQELNRIYATGLHYDYAAEDMAPLMSRLREIYQFYLMTRWPEQDWPRETREEVGAE